MQRLRARQRTSPPHRRLRGCRRSYTAPGHVVFRRSAGRRDCSASAHDNARRRRTAVFAAAAAPTRPRATSVSVGAPAGANAAPPHTTTPVVAAPPSSRGRGAGVVGANFRSAEVEGVAGETRRRMSEGRSDEFASPPPRRPPPRAAPSDARGRDGRRPPPPRRRGRIGVAPDRSSAGPPSAPHRPSFAPRDRAGGPNPVN
jgi:hypothetical protein